VVSGGFRWRFTPKIPAVFLAFWPHNAEAEGSSPSLTTKIKAARRLLLVAHWRNLSRRFRAPYPSKTDRQTILSAAVKQLAHAGIRDLSLRNLAASLDLAPNAIYRYVPDRPALEAALASEAARQLELVLRKAADGCEPITAIRGMSSAAP
jgi:hypothetical protein